MQEKLLLTRKEEQKQVLDEFQKDDLNRRNYKILEERLEKKKKHYNQNEKIDKIFFGKT